MHRGESACFLAHQEQMIAESCGSLIFQFTRYLVAQFRQVIGTGRMRQCDVRTLSLNPHFGQTSCMVSSFRFRRRSNNMLVLDRSIFQRHAVVDFNDRLHHSRVELAA